MTVFGYCRVSDEDQNLEQQIAELVAAGVKREQIHCEKMSGKKATGREELELLLRFMREGDELVVSKLDRFARNTIDTLTLITGLAERGIKFRSLAESWANVTNENDELMLTFMAGIATWERKRMLARQKAGIKRATDGQERRENGKLKYAGRPATIDRAAIKVDLDAGMKPTHVARKHRVSRVTVYEVKNAG